LDSIPSARGLGREFAGTHCGSTHFGRPSCYSIIGPLWLSFRMTQKLSLYTRRWILQAQHDHANILQPFRTQSSPPRATHSCNVTANNRFWHMHACMRGRYHCFDRDPAVATWMRSRNMSSPELLDYFWSTIGTKVGEPSCPLLTTNLLYFVGVVICVTTLRSGVSPTTQQITTHAHVRARTYTYIAGAQVTFLPGKRIES
jgi:hypothetical protein